MNRPDDLQQLWQRQTSNEELNGMWMQLIQEKQTGFEEWKRAGKHAEYAVALALGPLLALLAWKAKFAWVQTGYGLLAVTLVSLALATWLGQRVQQPAADQDFRSHLEALIANYNQSLRFLRTMKLWVSIPISVGVLAVIMGIPGLISSLSVWTLTLLLLTAFLTAQWLSYQRSRTVLVNKRQEASRLLDQLISQR